jgi:hypothetical protein
MRQLPPSGRKDQPLMWGEPPVDVPGVEQATFHLPAGTVTGAATGSSSITTPIPDNCSSSRAMAQQNRRWPAKRRGELSPSEPGRPNQLTPAARPRKGIHSAPHLTLARSVEGLLMA